jgi:hypothetical protein
MISNNRTSSRWHLTGAGIYLSGWGYAGLFSVSAEQGMFGQVSGNSRIRTGNNLRLIIHHGGDAAKQALLKAPAVCSTMGRAASNRSASSL